jgi:heme O synthase-like polyprenyltransferase
MCRRVDVDLRHRRVSQQRSCFSGAVTFSALVAGLAIRAAGYCRNAQGLAFLYFGLKFVLRRSRSAARRLLGAWIIYLPLFFVLSMLCRRARS